MCAVINKISFGLRVMSVSFLSINTLQIKLTCSLLQAQKRLFFEEDLVLIRGIEELDLQTEFRNCQMQIKFYLTLHIKHFITLTAHREKFFVHSLFGLLEIRLNYW